VRAQLPLANRGGQLHLGEGGVWLEWDPIEMLATHADHLRQLKLLYMDCDAQEQFNLQFGARQMSNRLTALGIAHECEEFDDNHNDIQYRYDVSLPKLAHALATE
jgi:hypothetical protein